MQALLGLLPGLPVALAGFQPGLGLLGQRVAELGQLTGQRILQALQVALLLVQLRLQLLLKGLLLGLLLLTERQGVGLLLALRV